MSNPSTAGTGATKTQQVVWWRNREADFDLPRTYGVGWACADGSRTGRLALRTPHRWLPAVAIEAELQPLLAAQLGRNVALRVAGDAEPHPVVRLAQAGYRVMDRDLASEYGLEVVGGVVAELRGRGCWGVVVLQHQLNDAVRAAVAGWAETALAAFAVAAARDLLADGWDQAAPGRWQLLARQPG